MTPKKIACSGFLCLVELSTDGRHQSVERKLSHTVERTKTGQRRARLRSVACLETRKVVVARNMVSERRAVHNCGSAVTQLAAADVASVTRPEAVGPRGQSKCRSIRAPISVDCRAAKVPRSPKRSILVGSCVATFRHCLERALQEGKQRVQRAPQHFAATLAEQHLAHNNSQIPTLSGEVDFAEARRTTG